MAFKYELIKRLADGKFHSGEELGAALQVSRSAVWKSIQQLIDVGINVISLKGKGYQIPNGLELLDKHQIINSLPQSIAKRIDLELLQDVDSTNQYLLDNVNSKPLGSIVIAEHQSKGRGRRHRKWFSPFGSNLYFSILWSFDKDPSELSGLSLATGVAVANTLEKYGIRQLQLKWPNDILFNYKKLSGILIEMTAETYSSTQVVIGIGINLNIPFTLEIDQPWTDVATILGRKPERNLIAAYLIQEVVEMLTLFQEKGFSSFFKYWQALDAYFGKPVVLVTPQQVYKGLGNGINRQGEFILLNKENKEIRFLHGEVSLRQEDLVI